MREFSFLGEDIAIIHIMTVHYDTKFIVRICSVHYMLNAKGASNSKYCPCHNIKVNLQLQ